VLAVSLALGCSVCYGVSNFLGPQLAKGQTIVAVLVLSQVAALLVCVGYVVVAADAPLPAGDAAVAGLAGLGNAAGLIGFYRAAELGPLAIVAPIGATGAAVPVLFGLATGDALEPWQAAGIVLAMAGAVLAARQGRAEEALDRGYPDPRASALWATGSALAFGIFLTALPSASDEGQAWALLDARLALVVLLLAWAGRRLVEVPLGRPSFLLSVPGLLLVLGTALYTAAAGEGQLSLVSVLGSLFPVVTVGLGVAVLGERLTRAQAVGVASALAGIVLIAA
jgi:drug/metabolite transporter (DMT)-like permease